MSYSIYVEFECDTCHKKESFFAGGCDLMDQVELAENKSEQMGWVHTGSCDYCSIKCVPKSQIKRFKCVVCGKVKKIIPYSKRCLDCESKVVKIGDK